MAQILNISKPDESTFNQVGVFEYFEFDSKLHLKINELVSNNSIDFNSKSIVTVNSTNNVCVFSKVQVVVER